MGQDFLGHTVRPLLTVRHRVQVQAEDGGEHGAEPDPAGGEHSPPSRTLPSGTGFNLGYFLARSYLEIWL